MTQNDAETCPVCGEEYNHMIATDEQLQRRVSHLAAELSEYTNASRVVADATATLSRCRELASSQSVEGDDR